MYSQSIPKAAKCIEHRRYRNKLTKSTSFIRLSEATDGVDSGRQVAKSKAGGTSWLAKVGESEFSE